MPAPAGAVNEVASPAAVSLPSVSPPSTGTGGGPAAEPLTLTAAATVSRQARGASRRPAVAASVTSSEPADVLTTTAAQLTSLPVPALPPVRPLTASATTASALGNFSVPIGPIRAAIIAAQAYIYGYPILAVQRVQSLLGPLNTMNLNTSFASADDATYRRRSLDHGDELGQLRTQGIPREKIRPERY
jgi:hypothetical protein